MSRVHLIGAGSIGTLFAHHLATAGHPTTLLLRSPASLAALEARQGRLTVEVPGAPGSSEPQLCSSVVSAEVAGHSRNRQQQQQIDTLIVTTKAQHALEALASVRHRLGRQSVVVLLQNGVLGVFLAAMRQWETAAADRPAFLLGSTTHGAFRRGDFHVVHASPGTGSCVFGLPPASLQAEAAAQAGASSGPAAAGPATQRSSDAGAKACRQESSAGAGVSTHGDQQPAEGDQQLVSRQAVQAVQEMLALLGSIQELHPSILQPGELHQQLLLKLLINVCANPLSGLLHCRNGGMVGNPAAEQIWRHLIHEFCGVFAAELVSSNSSSSSSSEGSSRGDTALLEQQLFEQVRHVVDVNSTNYNSMLQSVVKREETEVEWLNGFVVCEGAARGVATPWNEMLLALIKAREAVPAHLLTHEQL